jgi:hypothetical protein
VTICGSAVTICGSAVTICGSVLAGWNQEVGGSIPSLGANARAWRLDATLPSKQVFVGSNPSVRTKSPWPNGEGAGLRNPNSRFDSWWGHYGGIG